MNSTPTRRPAIGTPVRVTFAGSTGYDTAESEGVVLDHDADSITIGDGEGTAEFTLFDRERSDGTAVLEVL